MDRVTTIIFDAFETLVQDTTQQWHETFRTIIDQQRLDLEAELLHQTWLEAGSGFRQRRSLPGAAFQSYFDAWRNSFERAFASLAVSGDPHAAVQRVFADLAARRPYPEVRSTLGAIQRQWRTAVLSNADDSFLLPALERIGARFEAVLSSEQAGVYKPQSRLFQEMLDRLGVAPQEAVYVGDRQLEDVHGAGQVGMVTVWINRSGAPANPDLPAPDFQVTSLREVPNLLTRTSD